MKPKAPAWLRESFKDGVDFRVSEEHEFSDGYYGCQLAQHDPLQRPCSGRLERFHYVNRQRIEAAMWEQLRGAVIDPCDLCQGPGVVEAIDRTDAKSVPSVVPCPACYGAGSYPLSNAFGYELMLFAAWDPRVGGIACEGMHRRYDNHATPPLIFPYDALPSHVTDWAEEKGLESQLEARCPRQVEPATKGGRQ